MKLLDRLVAEASLTAEDWHELEVLTLQDQCYAHAFAITAENVSEHLQVRSHLLQSVYPEFRQLCQSRFPNSTDLLDTLWDLWIPLALHLAKCRQSQFHPFIQGILGGQGTGKTTLGIVLTLLLKHLGYQTLSFSLDDLYKTHHDRLQLKEQDPRFIWRGPPGTHDVELGIQVLDQLRHPLSDEPVLVPRFDKSLWHGSGDRIEPQAVTNIDIVLFEGWFVGANPVAPSVFETAPAPIISEADRSFARDINSRLHDYLPLWKRLDSLIVLYPIDYRFSKQWRKQAEQEMRAAGKPGMSDVEIDQFVDYFWKALHPDLFIRPLVETPGAADLVIAIDQNHKPGAIYKSGFFQNG